MAGVNEIWDTLDVCGEGEHISTSTPNGPTLTPGTRQNRRKSRRSWFDKPSTKYEIAVEKEKRTKGRKSDVEDEILMLTHFTNPPKIGFGNIKIGGHKTRTLIIKNPHDYEQTVKVEKFPKKKNFSVEHLDFSVEAKGTFFFEISWDPVEEGNCREMILFVVDNSYRLQGFVYGSVEAPPKKKVIKRKGLLGSKVQKPFSVLHTQSLANIKKSYSPEKSNKKRKSKSPPQPKAEKKTSCTTVVPGGATSDKKEKEIESNIENEPPHESSVFGKENEPSSARRKSHRRSNTYVKMQDLDMSPIGLPPGTGKKTDINDILHSTVRSDGDSHVSPNDVKVQCQFENLTPQTPENQKLGTLVQVPQPFVSPNSFLHDSLHNNEHLDSPKTTGSVKKDENDKKFLSPDTFLKDLNNTLDKDKKESGVLNSIPSPDTVLNKSVPHEIVVKQLDTVKTALQKNKSVLGSRNRRPPVKQKEQVGNNTRRETFTKSAARINRRQSSIGTAGDRRETFVKKRGAHQASPFVEVPDACTSSPRRTTFTIKQKQNGRQNKNGIIGQTHNKISSQQNEHQHFEKDVILTETTVENEIETTSTTKYTEVVDTYTCTTVTDEEVVPTPERSLAMNQHRTTTTKTEISKTVDSSTVTKNRTLPTPERSACGKQLFSPATGQSFHGSSLSCGDNSSFGSPRRLPDSPLAAVVTKRVSVTVTKEKPSDALIEESERRLSTCLFGPCDVSKDDIDDDSLEDKPLEKHKISSIPEESETYLSPVINKTTSKEFDFELDTPMREAGVAHKIVCSESESRMPEISTSLQNKKQQLVEGSKKHGIECPNKKSEMLLQHHGKYSECLDSQDGEICSSKQTGKCQADGIDLNESFPKPQNNVDLNLDTPMRQLLDQNVRTNTVEREKAPGRRRSFWDKPCDLSLTLDNIDTPLREGINEDVNNHDRKSRRSFWEKYDESNLTPLVMKDANLSENSIEMNDGASPVKNVQQESMLEKEDSCVMQESNASEKNTSFPTTPYHLLPKTPNPDNSRRSTHIVEKPKVLNLNELQKKKLFSDETIPNVNVEEKDEVTEPMGSKFTEVVSSQNEEDISVSDRNLGNENPSENQNIFENEVKALQAENGPMLETLDRDVINQCNSTDKVKKPEGMTDFTKLKEKEDVQSCSKEPEKESEAQNGLFFISCSPEKPAKITQSNIVPKMTARQTSKPVASIKPKVSPKRPLSHARIPDNKRVKTSEQGLSQQTKVPSNDNLAQKRKNTITRDRPSTKVALNKGSNAVQGKVKAPVKGVAQSKLLLVKKTKTALPKHPMPFAAKNMYYDERWMEKQERGFVHWLNFVLTPVDEYQQTKKAKVDAGSLCVDNGRNNVKLAPTKEVLSFRAYAERRRMNQLRRAACRMFQSKEVVHVVQKIEVEVESGRLFIRKDRKVHADLGLKQAILDMLLSFNPLWLRIGLETTFGEMIPIQNNGDVIGLSRFIITRLLGNPDIASEFSHPSVPHLYKDGFADAISRHLLKKFLILVYFLDHAKTHRLVPQDPCLFCKDVEYKNCKTMLIEFSRDYLAGEGDITRHLGYLGYQIKHTQTAMDEFDYAVSNLATDLKDGIRLARVMEILSGDHSWTKKMRAPAISRLQKIHNMDLVFQVLAKQDVSVERNGSKVASRDIVDGHREKTLQLLWALIVQYQVGLLINKEQLEEEIKILERSLRVRNQLSALKRYEQILSQKKRDSMDPELFSQNEIVLLLMKWCRAVCAFYSIKVENFTVSFGDGRVLCHLIHHYHPALLPRERIHLQTMMTLPDNVDSNQSCDGSFSNSFGQDPFATVQEDSELFEQLLSSEKENFRLLYEKVSELGGIPLMLRSADMSNTIPDEKVVVTYVSYLCARLLDIRHESRAARVIQLAWRKHHLKKAHQDFMMKKKAVMVLQKVVRSFLMKRRQQRQLVAAIRIQTAWRGYQARKLLNQLKWEKENKKKIEAAKVIQRYLLACRDRRQYKKTIRAILCIQTAIRSHLQQKQYNRIINAVRTIQSKYRAYRLMAACRAEYFEKRQAAITIQSFIKMANAKKVFRQEKMALLIQKNWKRYVCQRQLKKGLSSAVKIQAWYRKMACMRKYQHLRKSTVVLQKHVRGYLLMKHERRHYLQQYNSCLALQRWWRTSITMRKAKQNMAATTIQAALRGYSARKKYQYSKSVVTKLQAFMRMCIARKQFQKQKAATMIIQKWYRRHLLVVKCQADYLKKKNAVVFLQSCVRRWKCISHYRKLQAATILVQSRVKTMLIVRKFKQMKTAATVIQTQYRARLVMKRDRQAYKTMKTSCIKIQSCWRGFLVRHNVSKMHRAATIIQTRFRGQMARDYYLCFRELVIKCQQLVRAKFHGQKERMNFILQKKSAVVIQSAFRGYVERQRYQITLSKVIKIQSQIKGYQQRRRFRDLKSATLTLQKHYRAMVEGRKVHIDYMVKKGAAITIQAFVRGFRVRQMFRKLNSAAVTIQTFVRMLSERKKYTNLKEKAIFCQRMYRSKVKCHNDHRAYLKLKNAAIIIQSNYRRLQVQREMQKQVNAAVKIQSTFRQYRDTKRFCQVKSAVRKCQELYRAKVQGQQARYEYLLIKVSTMVIQRYYRHYKVRKVMKRANHAATVIQAHYKCFRERKSYLTLKHATVTCQKIYWNKIVGKTCRNNYLTTKNAVIKIQAAVRGWKVRKEVQGQNRAATFIQSVYRGHVQKQKFLSLKRATKTLQRLYRAHVLGFKARTDFWITKGAVITLQSGFRGWKVRREVKSQHRAARKMQAAFRGYVQHEKFSGLKRAVLTCQSVYRAHVLGAKLRTEFLIKKGATITLQAGFRGWKVRREAEHKEKSSVIIQSMYRQYVQRRRFLRLKQAVLKCQRRYRAKLIGLKTRREFLIQKGAALIIEDWYYDCIGRRKEQKRHQAAILIQSCFRGYKIRSDYHKLRSAAIKIQRNFRNMQCMKRQRANYLAVKSATAVIQKYYRGYVARKNFGHNVRSVVKIQCAIKSWLQRRHYVALRSAVVCCQKRFRAKLSGEQQRQKFVKTRKAVVLIQSHVRKVLAQKAYHTTLSSIVIIQKQIRQYLAHKHFKKLKHAVQVISARWHGVLLTRKVQGQFCHMKHAAITVQSWWRGHINQRQYQQTYRCITKLQAIVRAKQQRHHFLVVKSSACVIQSHFRAYLIGRDTRRKYIQMKQSVITLQALIRAYHVRELVKRIRACIVIQSHYRRLICVRNYHQIRSSVIRIQSNIRCLNQRREFRTKMAAIVQIQRSLRKRLFIKNIEHCLEVRRKSAIKIQALVRGYLGRKLVREMKAVIVIQATMRMAIQRQKFQCYRRNVIIVQNCVRRHLAQRKGDVIRRQHSAATCIQRGFRYYKQRQLLQKQREARQEHLKRFSRVTWLNLAAIVIQRCYRKHQLMVQAREKLHKVIIIQRWMRCKLCRLRYLKFQRGLVLVQRKARAYLQRRETAALTIQAAIRIWLYIRKQKKRENAIIKLQAMWRGVQERRRSTGKKIEVIRKRVEKANRSATEDKKLGNRMASALDYLLRYKQLSYILEVLIHLDVATRLSAACCEKFVSVNAVQVIYRLIKGCNRSQPHMELLKYSVSILLNLAKYEKTVYHVYNVEGAVDTLVELMQIYREKGAIFNTTCMLLGILGMLDQCRMEVKEDKKMSDKIRSIHLLTARKHKIDETRQIRQARLLAAKSFNCSLPIHMPHKKQHKIKPDWVLRKDKMKEIQDPLTAINFVMESFQLKPK